MSAVDDYRRAHQYWDSPTFWPSDSDGPTAIAIADAAIAELEAENAQLRLHWQREARKASHHTVALEQAEAELAEAYEVISHFKQGAERGAKP